MPQFGLDRTISLVDRSGPFQWQRLGSNERKHIYSLELRILSIPHPIVVWIKHSGGSQHDFIQWTQNLQHWLSPDCVQQIKPTTTRVRIGGHRGGRASPKNGEDGASEGPSSPFFVTQFPQLPLNWEEIGQVCTQLVWNAAMRPIPWVFWFQRGKFAVNSRFKIDRPPLFYRWRRLCPILSDIDFQSWHILGDECDLINYGYYITWLCLISISCPRLLSVAPLIRFPQR